MSVRAAVLGLVVVGVGCGGGASSPVGPTPSTDPGVGPAGGTLTSPDGTARLVIPAGAASGAVTLRAPAGLPLDPHAAAGSAIEVTGGALSAPATLVLRYQASALPSGIDEGELRLHVLQGGVWQVVGGSVDRAAREVTGSVSGPGTYGVRWPGPSAGCGAADHEFDFWLGSWSFTAPNAHPGTNDITAQSGGCPIEEHFVDAAGVRGRSVSLRSPVDGRWHQTYVDSLGGRLVLIGALEGQRMVLYETTTQRYFWDPVDPATVRYAGERSADGGATWSVFFDSRYTRR